MNDEALNMSIRKFLKMVGIRSQREIEQAVARGIGQGTLIGDESIPLRMTLEIGDLSVRVTLDGEIQLS